MAQSRKRDGGSLAGGPDPQSDTLKRISLMTHAREIHDFAKGYKVKLRSFAPDSIEAQRPDHGCRMKAVETSALGAVSAAERVLSGDLSRAAIASLFDTARGFEEAYRNMYSAESWAWLELGIYLAEAQQDPKIKCNPVAVTFIDAMLDLVQTASGELDFRSVLRPLERQIKSEHARHVAMAKNSRPRDWVREQWRERPDKGQSKAAFARQYAPLVKRRFDVPVTPETIARDWLPKG